MVYPIILIELYIVFRIISNQYWFEIFTRLVSTFNAFVCSYYAISNLGWNYLDFNYSEAGVIKGLEYLYIYLFVDGTFSLYQTIKCPNGSGILILIHHWIGGYGIYLMTIEKKGLGLGIYFMLTELSTPLLNLSWIIYTNKIKMKGVFELFWLVFGMVRIDTIPFLLFYLIYNRMEIVKLNWVHWFMTVGGSSILIGLNLIWFSMITKKIAQSDLN